MPASLRPQNFPAVARPMRDGATLGVPPLIVRSDSPYAQPTRSVAPPYRCRCRYRRFRSDACAAPHRRHHQPLADPQGRAARGVPAAAGPDGARAPGRLAGRDHRPPAGRVRPPDPRYRAGPGLHRGGCAPVLRHARHGRARPRPDRPVPGGRRAARTGADQDRLHLGGHPGRARAAGRGHPLQPDAAVLPAAGERPAPTPACS